MFAGIRSKLARFAGFPLEAAELLQVGRYEAGQKYDCHFDFHARVDAPELDREATVIVYLADLEEEVAVPDCDGHDFCTCFCQGVGSLAWLEERAV